MKKTKYLLLLTFLVTFQFVYAQSMTQEQWTKIRNEALLEFIQNGGTTDQWDHYSEQIVQEYYKRKYTYNNSGQVQRKQTFVAGTFIGASNYAVGSFRNGYVVNSMGQTLGYLSQGYFMNNQQQCVGYVNGSQIFSCNGNLLATVKSNGVYNAQGYLSYTLKGETLYSQNYFLVQITGMDIYSLAAYLLFF